MSAPIRLFSGPLSMFGAKAQIAALEKNLDVDVVMVPFDMDRLYEPKHPIVLRINPKAQVPILIHGDLEIFDSTQIFEYLEDLQPQPPLWPASVQARARARLLEHMSDEVFFPHIIRLMGLQSVQDDPVAIRSREAARLYYGQMEALLADRDYLAGDYSFADITFYMAQVFAARMGAGMAETLPRLTAWRERVTARPAVRSVLTPMAHFLIAHGRKLPTFMTTLVAKGV